jgi:FAD/FMN-containing dehydrogenase
MTMATDSPGVAGALREFGAHLRGQIVLPGDADYDESRRIWNAMHDRRPAAIVRAAGAADVIASVRFSRDHDLPMAVRGGGHSVAGKGTIEGGVVIDLGPMQGVRVDPVARTVRVEPGVTLRGMDRETEPFGLAVPIGVVSGTGVAGLTLGGGVGWLTRPYGLTVDNLLSADVVTADGRLVHASETHEPDLFWGLRGGGGNFGIVTSFEFRAHPLGPDVYAGALIYEEPQWRDALRAFDSWTETLPDEMNPIISFITPPPSWGLPNRTLMLMGFAWAGPNAAVGERVLNPLRAAPSPDTVIAEPTRWLAVQSAADELFPKGVRAYWKNASLDRLNSPVIDAIVDWAGRIPSPRTGFDIHFMRGVFGRVPEDATPFPNRAARYWLNMYAVWDSPTGDERGTAWARGFHSAVRPFAAAGEYVNFLGDAAGDSDSPEAALAAYGNVKVARLAALKTRWDPDNVFRMNHNIAPAR